MLGNFFHFDLLWSFEPLSPPPLRSILDLLQKFAYRYRSEAEGVKFQGSTAKLMEKQNISMFEIVLLVCVMSNVFLVLSF